MVVSLTKRELETYLNQGLNMALGQEGESTYTNSFECVVRDDGVLFIPRLPASYIIDDKLYQRIFLIANAMLYPRYTLLKQPSAYWIPLDTDDIHVQRALFFPWIKGIPERLIISDIEKKAELEASKPTIELMKDGIATLNLDTVTTILVSGTSSGGKSYFLTFLLHMLRPKCQLYIIDPKNSSPTRWAKKHNVPVIIPSPNRSKSDFLSQVNDVLSEALKTIHTRQAILATNPKQKFKRVMIVIEELLALTESVPSNIKNAFFSLLSEISLLGRETSVGLCLVSQRFDHKCLNLSTKEQANCLILLGQINSNTVQFLYPDIDPAGIVIPLGKGTGLVQIISDDTPYQILPFLSPTYYTKGETT